MENQFVTFSKPHGCSESMTIEIFMNQIDEVKRIQTLRNQIGEIQKELGFDDVVAEYVLQNAPDGADDKDLMVLAIESLLGPNGNASVDPSLSNSNALVFNTFAALKSFLANPVSSSFGKTINNGNGNTRTTVRMEYNDESWPFDYGVIATIDSKLEESNNPYELNAIESTTYGFMPIWNWSQLGGGVDLGNEDIGISDLGRMLKIDGIMKLGIIISDNSFSIDIPGSFLFLINRKTGEFIESEWKQKY